MFYLKRSRAYLDSFASKRTLVHRFVPSSLISNLDTTKGLQCCGVIRKKSSKSHYHSMGMM
ncbi:hypothetical protein NPIL_680021, partial [Nephila pilipes]